MTIPAHPFVSCSAPLGNSRFATSLAREYPSWFNWRGHRLISRLGVFGTIDATGNNADYPNIRSQSFRSFSSTRSSLSSGPGRIESVTTTLSGTSLFLTPLVLGAALPRAYHDTLLLRFIMEHIKWTRIKRFAPLQQVSIKMLTVHVLYHADVINFISFQHTMLASTWTHKPKHSQPCLLHFKPRISTVVHGRFVLGLLHAIGPIHGVYGSTSIIGLY